MISKTRTKHTSKQRQFESLGTFNEITIFDCFDDALLDSAVNRVQEIDDTMSAFKPLSDISRLNQSAGERPVPINPETLYLLSYAKKISEMSEGAFDITIRPLVELWGISKKLNFIPTQGEIDEAKKLVNFKDLELDKINGTSFLKKQGQAVDLGGIAKGYAAEEVKRILIEGGVKSSIINLGGNAITIGTQPDNQPWFVGVQNPTAPAGEFFGMISSVNKTIVTSGCNERFFMKDGVRYHHIIDPRTGKPAQSGLLSVTLVCDNSVDADALSTAVFVLGIEKSIGLLKKYEADAIFATEDCNVFVTDGIKDRFKMK
ncbi:MAG: FAD:protein FMN transferase [Clostridia bacterium]